MPHCPALLVYYLCLIAFTIGLQVGNKWPGLRESLIASPEVSQKTCSDKEEEGEESETDDEFKHQPCDFPDCYECLPKRRELADNIQYYLTLRQRGNLSRAGRQFLAEDIELLLRFDGYRRE
jgi:hypothetical protein